MKQFIVQPETTGQRLDIYIAGLYPEFTRSSLQALFKEGHVLVDGQPQKAGYKLRAADRVAVNEDSLKTQPPDIELPIIYEDDQVVVIDKPAGLLTHSKGALNTEATVASFLKPQITDKNLRGNRAGIVHRLDRPTSGVIITAKTDKALKHLQKQFSQRKVKKTYIAVVEGDLEPSEAIIDAPIARNPSKPQTFIVNRAGKPAITHYKKLKSFQKNSRIYSLVKLKPETGRTHQIRVHMAYVNHPIVGDRLYGHQGPGMLLHAQSLEATLPSTERKIFRAKLPKRVKEFTQL